MDLFILLGSSLSSLCSEIFNIWCRDQDRVALVEFRSVQQLTSASSLRDVVQRRIDGFGSCFRRFLCVSSEFIIISLQEGLVKCYFGFITLFGDIRIMDQWGVITVTSPAECGMSFKCGQAQLIVSKMAASLFFIVCSITDSIVDLFECLSAFIPFVMVYEASPMFRVGRGCLCTRILLFFYLFKCLIVSSRKSDFAVGLASRTFGQFYSVFLPIRANIRLDWYYAKPNVEHLVKFMANI